MHTANSTRLVAEIAFYSYSQVNVLCTLIVSHFKDTFNQINHGVNSAAR